MFTLVNITVLNCSYYILGTFPLIVFIIVPLIVIMLVIMTIFFVIKRWREWGKMDSKLPPILVRINWSDYL